MMFTILNRCNSFWNIQQKFEIYAFSNPNLIEFLLIQLNTKYWFSQMHTLKKTEEMQISSE